jgi:uncharacterized membrane protein YhaH (DUF805 family)
MDSVPPLDFFAAVRLCLRKYADFRGRAPRAEFWWWALFQWLAGSALNMIAVTCIGLAVPDAVRFPLMGTAFLTQKYAALCNVTWLVFLLPGLAVTVRRLHDTNRSGWCSLLGWAPLLISVLAVTSGALLRLQDRPDIVTIIRDIAVVVALLCLLLFFGWIRFLVAIFKQGTTGDNRFGPDPTQDLQAVN